MDEAEFKSMFDPAELHSDLTPYLVEGKPFDMLQHPLVYGVPYHSQMNNHYNRQLEQKKERLTEALKTKDVWSYVFLHERPYRLNAFCEFIEVKHVKSSAYWQMLGAIWEDSENIWQNLNVWKRMLKSERPQRQFFMEDSEREALKKLPTQFTVYRGCLKGLNEEGLSWTLDKAKAEWFSTRYRRNGEQPCVHTKTVRRKDVFAHLLGRNESEVIIL
jgi:hypothetical protein